MRVGIVTQVLLNNYGGTLQNYALQKVLTKLGHNPITLDYIPRKSWIRVVLSILLTPFLYFTPKRRDFKDCLPCKRDKFFRSFISNNIITSEMIDHYDSSLIDKYQLDAIIVGSDQVWRPSYNSDVLFDNYLQFTTSYAIKRIAYAASFGVSRWEYTQEQQRVCSKLIRNFKAVSVREESAVELCNNYLGVKAQLVLDPTLLLNKYDYQQLMSKQSSSDNTYILSYILNPSSKKDNFISSYAEHFNIAVKSINVERSNRYSVEEWLFLFNTAQYVITDSFHGTVFSIVFHRPFLVIDNPARGSSRMKSLLDKLNLSDHIISEDLLNVDTLPNVLVDCWEEIDEYLTSLQASSIDFLRDALSN